MNHTLDENFIDLEIRILRRQDEGYPVEITLGGQQEFSGVLAADILPWIPSSDLIADGQRLFGKLFADGALLSAWAEARGRAPQRRIRLRIDPDAAELHTLPWELLEEDQVMLSASEKTPFSRYLPIELPWGSLIEDRPIRLLAVMPDPSNVEEKYSLPQADVARERESLEAAFAGAGDDLQVDFLDPPVTLERLEEKLRDGYHILHYLGHGAFSEDRGQAVLYMQDDRGLTRLVFDDELAQMLARQGVPPPLVFLAACQTAARSTTDAFLGMAPKLVSVGVPAVVAMRESITVDSALRFGTMFYQCLLEHGDVDLATNQARSTLLTAGHPDADVPVLFMRLKDGRLWRVAIEEGQRHVLPFLSEIDPLPAGSRPLTPESVVERSRPDLEGFHVSLPTNSLRRQLLTTLAEAITNQRALVILYGEGGCGKSVALKQWALELVSSLPPGTGVFTTLRLAHRTPSHWIARTVADWAGLPDYHDLCYREHSYALACLKRANPDLPFPIMHLGLDDLDEHVAGADLVRIVTELINWFWEEDKRARQNNQPPRAILVITCRDQANLLNKWLNLDVSGFRRYDETPYSIPVDRFLSGELLQAALETGVPDLYSRIEAVLDLPVGELRSSAAVHQPVAVTAAKPPPPANRQVVKALHHPAMWGSLLGLPPELQHSALTGESDGLQAMARVFVERFCTMACRRRRDANLGEARLHSLLSAIARHCNSQGRRQLRHPDSDWLTPAQNDGLSKLAAQGLQHEAFSGGLIVRDDSKVASWQWSHTLVGDYLASDSISPQT